MQRARMTRLSPEQQLAKSEQEILSGENAGLDSMGWILLSFTRTAMTLSSSPLETSGSWTPKGSRPTTCCRRLMRL